MTNVILVAHILVSIILVVVVLMQRSEGGALGIGGGGGAGGGLMSGRGVTGALVRTTIIFGAIFFVSSLTLTTLASRDNAASNDIVPTEVGRDADSTVPDNLGIDNLDDILDADSDLLEDPLAVGGVVTDSADDPLATPAEPAAADDDPLNQPPQ